MIQHFLSREVCAVRRSCSYACRCVLINMATSKLPNENSIANQVKVYSVLAEDIKRNLIFSPYSLSAALSLLSIGADQECALEIRNAISATSEEKTLCKGFKMLIASFDKDHKDFKLETGTRIYIRNGYPISESFLKRASKYFKAAAENVSLPSAESCAQINGWVAKKTREKITSIVDHETLSADTQMILVNVIYLKATWLKQFEEYDTRKENFYACNRKKMKVQMMHQTEDYFGESSSHLGAHILDLPYQGVRLSMLIFLPDKPAGFPALEKQMDSFDLVNFKPKDRRTYEISLPKFKIESHLSLNQPLQKLGAKRMFQGEFSRLSSQSRLQVSSVRQTAIIEVNEAGTEAAAATAIDMTDSYTPRREVTEFCCNRPFIIAIRDNFSGTVLFMGKIMQPSE